MLTGLKILKQCPLVLLVNVRSTSLTQIIYKKFSSYLILNKSCMMRLIIEYFGRK